MALYLCALLPALTAHAAQIGSTHNKSATELAGTIPDQASNAVVYHEKSNTLDVRVKDMPLTSVLGEISRQSSVQILMDPAANRNTTITLKDVPLDTALKRLARGLNYSFIYDHDKKHPSSSLLISMSILPSGRQESAYLQPVIPPVREAAADNANNSPQNLSDKRWMARLNKLPASARNKLLKEVKEQEKMQKAFQARRKLHTEMLMKHLEADKASHQRRMDSFKQTNPTLYQLRQQQIQQAAQKMSQELQQQQPAGK